MNRGGIAVIGTAVLLSATLIAAIKSDRSGSFSLARDLSSFPTSLGEWASTLPAQPLDPQTEKTLGATEYVERIFTRNSGSVDFFMAYYANQRAGESMHSPLNCLPGSGWEFWSRGVVSVPVGNKTVRVNRDGIQNGSDRKIVLYWYQTPKRIFADEYLGKLYLVEDSITTGRTEGSIVRLVVPDRPEAEQDAIALASLVVPQVRNSFAP